MEINSHITAIPKLLTLKETAIILGVSEMTIRRLIENRYLPFYRVGRSLRFAEQDVNDYLASNRVDPIRR